MDKIYANYVEKYRKKMNECNDEWSKLYKARNFYRQKRVDYRITTKCLLGIFPALILFLIATILMSNDILHASFMRYSIILGFVLSFFVFEPLLNRKNLKKLKEYEYLIKDKTRTQIIIDDFTNYYERIKLEHKHRIYEDLKDKNFKEMEKHSKLDKTLGELSKYCEINVKAKKYSKKEIDKMEEKKESLLQQYKEKEEIYEDKVKELAVVTFFDKFFREDIMQTIMKLMMAGLCIMLYWNMPFAVEKRDSVNNFIIILNMIIPFVGCFIVYYAYRYFIRKIQKPAFKHVLHFMNGSLDIKSTEEDLRSNINTEIAKIRLELVDIRDSIDLIDILLEQNEK